MLVEVVAALQYAAEGSVKRQWLVDAVEISCVSSYPSTVGISSLSYIGKRIGECFQNNSLSPACMSDVSVC